MQVAFFHIIEGPRGEGESFTFVKPSFVNQTTSGVYKLNGPRLGIAKWAAHCIYALGIMNPFIA